MSHLVTLDNVSLAFGLDILLDKVKLQISNGERICLIGRNGAGKSSLLKIIEGTTMPDSGIVWRKSQLRLARLSQELPQSVTSTVFEFVAEGLSETGTILAKYYALTEKLTKEHTQKDIIELERLQKMIDEKNAWNLKQDITTILTRLELNPDQHVTELSGGWQRRAALAQALVSSPELLLLDEPTNHLDIEGIKWLENQLIALNTGILFITHDRTLLQRLATRIIELDRGQLTSWPYDYPNFLRRKEEMLHAEIIQDADFDKKLALEERWIRQGIKARRTRNEGRVRALEKMRLQRSLRRETQGKASFNLNDAEKSGQLVIFAENITHEFNHRVLIDHFSTRIMRGDKIGLIGPNGIGKSTLLNILLGNIMPQQGTVTQGTKLKIAYFDQLRKALDLEKTVVDNVGLGSDFIEINGKKQHIMSYLSDFLFTPERARTPVKALSGGECNRLLLARLFSLPTNLLILDEPTNDLDIETLELLEELLSNYEGTLLLVSHDREFLDNVVTSTIVFEGEGIVKEYVGGYQDWIRQKADLSPSLNKKDKIPQETNLTNTKKNKKLSYKEQQEFDSLPNKIESIEYEQQHLQHLIATPEFYKSAPETITKTMEKIKQLETDLELAYQRWDELEKIKKS